MKLKIAKVKARSSLGSSYSDVRQGLLDLESIDPSILIKNGQAILAKKNHRPYLSKYAKLNGLVYVTVPIKGDSILVIRLPDSFGQNNTGSKFRLDKNHKSKKS